MKKAAESMEHGASAAESMEHGASAAESKEHGASAAESKEQGAAARSIIGYMSRAEFDNLMSGRTHMPMILDPAGLKTWREYIDSCGGPVRVEISEVSLDYQLRIKGRVEEGQEVFDGGSVATGERPGPKRSWRSCLYHGFARVAPHDFITVE